MKTFQLEVEITENQQLTLQLPADVKTGKYQVVLFIQSQDKPKQPPHHLNNLAGQIHSFSEVDSVQYQQRLRDEWKGENLNSEGYKKLPLSEIERARLACNREELELCFRVEAERLS